MTTVNQYRVWCTNVVAHYEYVWGTTPPTVCPSDASPIDTALTTVVQTVSSSDTIITNLPRGAFGGLAVEEANPILQLYFGYSLIVQDVSSVPTGSGTATNANNMAVISSGAAMNSSAILRSVKPAKYRSGQGILLRFTGVYTQGVAGNTQTVGCFDDENGVGFGYNGTSFGLFKRNGGVTIWVAQTAWNVDTFDGTGPSGVNINFGLGLGNVFQIQYQYLGFGGFIYSVENPSTAKFVVVHIVANSNSLTSPSFTTPSFPLSIASINTTNNTNIVVKSASMYAGVEGPIIYTGPQFTSVWNGTAVSNGTETFIAAFNDRLTFNGKTNRTITYIQRLSFATGSTDKAQILRIRRNAAFTTPTWMDIDTTQSTIQNLTAGTWNAGTGTILLQQNVAGFGVPTTINITPSASSLFMVNGFNLVITLEGLGGGNNWGSISWLEDQ